ncbi:putative DASH complex subunit DAD2 [Talaromyces proteolyticus]|uniref:DASH complex subunit DAD2 n=1 Tax=Talaromyces proteolyticus TaxID=1131652 RepID=A0AAD4KIB5_9EURO|nr:putative DASH complex subunit DAD2 [Talaromyces proteolyticus]KAH8693097.1 putative DASH complex subunit DAD2 [Talaromyces proteolyticus]
MAPLRQNDAYSASSQQAVALTMRIEAKKAELENLCQLRDFSNALATKMQVLETKLSTLKDGTEAIACVLTNWENVLQAINMATRNPVASTTSNNTEESRLPTLVRVPISSNDTSPAT